MRTMIVCVLMVGSGIGLAAAQEDTTLRYGEVGQGHLSAMQSEDHWHFAGRAGDLIMIDMQAAEPDILDTYLTLEDSDGNSLASDDDSGENLNARIGPYSLPNDGDYSIIAASYSGDGDYSVQVINLSALPVIAPGKPLVGVVNSTHPSDYFLINNDTAEQNMFLLTAKDDDLYSDPVLSLYGESGFITSSEYQDEALIDPVVAIPGEYYVIIVNWNPVSRGGPYELLLDQSDIELLEDGISQTDSLDYETYMRQHYFNGEENQLVRVTVIITDGNIAPRLEIVSADSTTYLFTSDSQIAREISVVLELPASGTYAVYVSDGGYEGGEGTYEVRLDVLGTDEE